MSRATAARRALLAAGPAILRDVVGLTGAALLVRGISEIFVPAAYVAAGLLMIAAAVLLARRG